MINLINSMIFNRIRSVDRCSSLHASYLFLNGSKNLSFQQVSFWDKPT